jgi:iron transport multicopper oxidase
MLDSDPAYVNPDVFGWLVYNDKKPLPTPTPLRTYNTLDDTLLVPQDHEPLLEKVDNQIVLTMNFDVEDSINRQALAFG